MKGKLNDLSNEYLKGYFDNTIARTEKLGADFVNAKVLMKSEYYKKAVEKFGRKEDCMEIGEAYDNWYKDRNLEAFITNFKEIGQEIRIRLLEEQRQKAENNRLDQLRTKPISINETNMLMQKALEEQLNEIKERSEQTRNSLGSLYERSQIPPCSIL